jgi:Leucine Rich repeat
LAALIGLSRLALGVTRDHDQSGIGKFLHGADMVALGCALATCQQLQWLELDCLPHDNAGVLALAPAFVQLSSLVHLTWTGCSATEAAAHAVAGAMSAPKQRMTYLDLRMQYEGSACQPAQAFTLRRAPLSSLRYLELASIQAESGAVSGLADALAGCTMLTRMRLTASMHDDAFAALAPCLSALHSLAILIVAGADVKQASAAIMGPVLTPLISLTHLSMARCDLSGAGAVGLAPWLGRLPRLRHLSLQAARIDDAGATALSQHLHQLTQLTRLDMARNQGIRINGAIALAERLGGLSRQLASRWGDRDVVMNNYERYRLYDYVNCTGPWLPVQRIGIDVTRWEDELGPDSDHDESEDHDELYDEDEGVYYQDEDVFLDEPVDVWEPDEGVDYY